MLTAASHYIISRVECGCCQTSYLPCRETGDQRVLPILKRLVTFFESQATVVAGYTLDGLPLENYTHTCFQAPVWCLFSVRTRLQPSLSTCKLTSSCCGVYTILRMCAKEMINMAPHLTLCHCMQIMNSPQVAKMEREMSLTTPDVYFGAEPPSAQYFFRTLLDTVL